MGTYVLNYFLAGSSDFLEYQMVAWQLLPAMKECLGEDVLGYGQAPLAPLMKVQFILP